MILDWVGQVADLIKVIIQKVVPTGEEREKTRQEKAKESWDAFEKKARKLAEENDRNSRDQ